VKWMSGGAKRKCNRALHPPPGVRRIRVGHGRRRREHGHARVRFRARPDLAECSAVIPTPSLLPP
jgi:hypothetical protein